MLLEGVEVTVTVEKQDIALNAPCRDKSVNGLSDRDAMKAQCTEVACCLDGELSSAYLNLLKGKENILGLVEVALGAEALQDFSQHEVSNG
jgi:hypothetical protein